MDVLNWVWPMVVVDASDKVYIEELPLEYSSDMIIKYHLNAINFNYKFDKQSQTIIPYPRVLGGPKRTYETPKSFILDKEKQKIHCYFSQDFMTSKGRKTSTIKAIYKQVEVYPKK